MWSFRQIPWESKAEGDYRVTTMTTPREINDDKMD